MLSNDGGSVYVVDKEGQAAVRPIKLGNMVADVWIVESGLKPGDVVIVSNLQKIRPSAPVKIVNTPTGPRPSSEPVAKPSDEAR